MPDPGPPPDTSACDFRSSGSTGADHCTGGTSRFVALHLLRVAREDPVGVASGFNLDGRVSDDTDPQGCFQPDFVAPDGVPGVDNQLAVIAPVIESAVGTDMDATLDIALRTGALVLVLEIRHIDGDNDDCVDVLLHDARALDTSVPVVSPDGRLVPAQRFALLPGTARRYEGGRVVEGRLETSRSGIFPLLISTASAAKGALFDLTRARLRFRLRPADLSEGLVGGQIATNTAANAFSCASSTLPEDLLRDTLESIADLDVDPVGSRQSMSAALTFEAVTAFVR